MISLKKLVRDNFEVHQGDILFIERSSFPSPWSLEAFSTELERTISHFWIAQIHTDLVGYICFWMFAREIHLMNFAVHPMWRRNGVGRRLMDKMIDTGLSGGAQVASLEVRPSNTRARTFYHKLGFKVIGRRPHYYDDTKEDAIIMAISLTTKAPD
ncbi:MAG: ribosomal protein S18-alanine N-acetyltransferase [Desulfatiglandaceae bacterium]